MSVSIRLAQSPDDFSAVKSLIRQYVDWLGLDLSFQSFNKELDDLAGKYRPPASGIFLARLGNREDVGCFGYAPLHLPNACEAKRLFVLPEARGRNIARSLISTVISEAASAGYSEIFLDTLPTMTAAIALYGSFGFEQVDPYYDNPIKTAMFFRRPLSCADRS